MNNGNYHLHKISDTLYETRSEAQTSIFEYIEVFYNRHRRHSSLDYKSPVDFERLAEVA